MNKSFGFLDLCILQPNKPKGNTKKTNQIKQLSTSLITESDAFFFFPNKKNKQQKRMWMKECYNTEDVVYSLPGEES